MTATAYKRGLFIATPVVASVGLWLMINGTDPAKSGPLGVLVVFGLLYVLSVWVAFFLLHIGIQWASRLIKGVRMNDTVSTRRFSVGARKAYYIATIVSFVPVILLAMRSFAELRIVDVVLLLAFVVIAIFFIVKRS